MAVEIRTADLLITRKADRLEVDFDDLQGLWTEEQYFKLTDRTNHFVEFTDGFIEFPPMPTDKHQAILAFLFELFLLFIRPQGGKVRFAPLRLQIRPGKQREPDILLVRDAHDPRRQNRFWLAACRREWGLGRHRAIFQKSRFGFVMRYSRFSPTNC